MLTALIGLCLRHRALVLILAFGSAIAAGFAVRHLPLDAFPDTTPVQVQINSVWPALSPIEVEQQLTAPIEQAISGLKGLAEVRSLSKFGLSQVTVQFVDGVDVYLARQQVAERLAAVDLPVGAPRPTLGPVATGLGEVFHYIVSSTAHDLTELRTIQDWVIRPQLRRVPGVAEVNSWGGREKQYQVVIDPTLLLKHQLTLSEVADAILRNNANVGGGLVTRAGESLLVQGVGRVRTVDEIGSIVIASRDGVPLHVHDVATVIEGHEIPRGAATYQGKGEAVLGLGFMLMGENSREITERLRQQLDQVRKSLPAGVTATTVYDRTELIDHVLATVRTNLFEGALLVIAVLFIFLGNLRAGLIVALAIPLSMLFAGSLMLRVGIAGSLMSLGAIDFGLIVDSSVIMIENAVRRLGSNSDGRSRLDVVRDAAVEVRRPTLFGECIILIVYLPILTLEGIEGKLFAPMAWTVVFALLGSMILSLTLMPVLASLWLPAAPRHAEPWLVRLLQRVYRPLLGLALRHRAVVVSVMVAALATGGMLASRLGAVFIPRLSEEAVVINTIRLAGVSLDESVRYGTQIEKLLLDRFPAEIRQIWTRTGSAEIATDPMGLEVSDVFITLHPRRQWKRAASQEQLVDQMQRELSGMPGMRTAFAQPIELRVNELVAGVRSDLGVKLFGDDFDQLKSLGAQIESVLRGVPGSADLATEQITGQPVLEITLRPDQLARFGIAGDDVLDYVAMLGNKPIGEIRGDRMRFPLTLRLPDDYRTDPDKIGGLLIPTAGGLRLPLSQLAHVRLVEGPATINREWGQRRLIVQCNVRGRDLAGFVSEARRRLDAELKRPAGYHIQFGGQFEHLQRAARRLAFIVPIALGLVLLLLYLTYNRVADVVRIFLTLPVAAVGGLLALWLRDLPFSISAGVGFIAMSGVAMLGDMVYVSALRRRLRDGVPLPDALVETALTRLRPVLMTGLVAALGFVPMAFNTGVGAEVQRPLATVVIGCTITSTVLTLLFLPVLYSLRRGGVPAASAE